MHLTLGPGQQLSCLFYGRYSRWLHITGEKKEKCGLSGTIWLPKAVLFPLPETVLNPLITT